MSILGDTKAYFEDTELKGEDPDWIIPWRNTEPSDEEEKPLSSEFAALLVPGEISAKGLIRINLDVKINNVPISREFIYKPASNRISSHESGVHYRYVITVRRERIVVQDAMIELWEMANENGGTVHDAVFRVNMPWAGDDKAYKSNIAFTKVSDNVKLCDPDNRVLDLSEPSLVEKGGPTPDDFDHLLVSGNDFEFTYTLQPDESAASVHNETRAFVAPDEDLYSMSRTADFEGNSYNDKDAYFEISQKMSLRSRTVNLSYELYAEVGDYYYSDGTWLSKLVDSPDKYCIGLVFHVGPGLEDNIDFYSEEPDFVDWLTDENQNRIRKKKITGYVIALHDAKMDNKYKSDPDYPYYKNREEEYNDDEYVHRPGLIDYSYMGENDIYRYFHGYADHKVYSGYYGCKILYPRLIDGYNSYKMYQYKTLPYQACLAYYDTWPGGGIELSTPPGSSGWYLPSFGQIYDAYRLPYRVEKIKAIGNFGNRIDEVYDFVISDNVFDIDHTILYNTISSDMSTAKGGAKSSYHMLFDPTGISPEYRLIINVAFVSSQTPPTHTRPILTF